MKAALFLCLVLDRSGHILCPGGMWEHLQPLALLKMFQSPVATKPWAKVQIWIVCVRLLTKKSHLLALVWGCHFSFLVSPAAFSRPVSLASCNAQYSAENPKQLALLNTKGMNVVKEGNELWLLVKPHSRKLVCLQHCRTLLTSCLAFKDISVYI